MARSRKAVSLGGRGGPTVKPGHQDATTERLRHADRDGSATVDGQGVRRIGDPFDLLHARQLLDRDSPARNGLLWQAGERLRRHWHGSRLDGLAAFDFTRDSVDVSRTPDSSTRSEAAFRHGETLRAAIYAIGPRHWPYVTSLVLDGRTVADLRPLVTDTGHARTADALVIERLREGLERLCDLWRMTGRERTGRLVSWRDDGGRDGSPG